MNRWNQSARGRLILALMLAVLLIGLQKPGADDPAEYRGIWACIWDLNTTSKITEVVNDCHNHNINAIFAHIRVRGDAYYFPNRIDSNYTNTEPRTQYQSVSPSALDVLQELIDRAHDTTGGKRYVEVHAWIVTYPCWPYDYVTNPPSSPNHVVNAHPEWLMKDYLGNIMKPPTYGNCQIDPGNPQVQNHLYNVSLDIVRNYDVDGVHFDYIRYDTAADCGYNDGAKTKFQSETGFTIGSDTGITALWDQWRRQQVANLVERIYDRVKIDKPWVKVSAFLIGYEDSVAGLSHQSYNHWSKEGKIDVLFGGQYTATLSYLQSTFERACRYAYGQDTYSGPRGAGSTYGADTRLCGNLGVYLGGYTVTTLLDQVNYLRGESADGFCCFDWDAMNTNSEEKFTALSQVGGPCDAWAPTPIIFDADTVAPNAPVSVNLSTAAGKITITFNRPAAAADGDYPIQYRIYRDTDSTIERHWSQLRMILFDDTASRSSFSWEDVEVTPGQPYYYEIIAYDDWHNAAAATVSGTPTGASFIIESAAGGQNNSWYSETAGTWNQSSSHSAAPGCTPPKDGGIGSRFCYLTDPKEEKCEFRPNITVAGQYELFITTFNYSSANAPNTKIKIVHKNGTTTIYRDVTQANCGDTWYSLGTYEFNTGTSGYVEFDNSTCTLTGSGYRLNTAAMKWSTAPGGTQQPWESFPNRPSPTPAPPASPIVADDKPRYLEFDAPSNWTFTSTDGSPYNGNKAYKNDPADKAAWHLKIPYAGAYAIDGFAPVTASQYSNDARYRFIAQSGAVNVTTTQEFADQVPDGWKINVDGVSDGGAYAFNAGDLYIAVWDSDDDGTQYCIADAVRTRYLGPTPVPTATPTPPPTPTPKPSATPTPSPTPTSGPQTVIDYTFDTSLQNWQFSTFTGFSLPTSGYSGGVISLSSPADGANRFGYWNSQPGEIPYESDKVFRASYFIRTDQATAESVPTIRLRWVTENLAANTNHTIVSTGEQTYVPGTASYKEYYSYFYPPVVANMNVSFDILDFATDENGTLFLDRVLIEKMARPGGIGAGTPVKTYDSAGDFSTWAFNANFGGAFGNVTSSNWGTGSLSISSTDANAANAGFFAAPSPSNDSTYDGTTRLYRAAYVLSIPTEVGTMCGIRMRCQNEDNQMTQTMEVTSMAGGVAMPQTTGTTYELYWETPDVPGSPETTEDGFFPALDVLDFDPALGGQVNLETITIEYF